MASAAADVIRVSSVNTLYQHNWGKPHDGCRALQTIVIMAAAACERISIFPLMCVMKGGRALGEEYSDWLREEASGRLL